MNINKGFLCFTEEGRIIFKEVADEQLYAIYSYYDNGQVEYKENIFLIKTLMDIYILMKKTWNES